METVTLKTELINAVLQYMSTKPYMEVVQLIDAIKTEAQKQAVSAQKVEANNG